ncbi:MAG: LON peptidase substrate-binding domain-containing protein [Thermoanaerobaculia bacterium]
MMDLRPDDLPAKLHLLPLDRFILLPGTRLPVTFAAPWARAIIEAALAAGGYVGVVQPEDGQRQPASRCFSVGCLARLHDEGREAEGRRVSLEGVIRFRAVDGLTALDRDPLAPVAVAYDEFLRDLEPGSDAPEEYKMEAFRDKMLDLAHRKLGGAGLLETMSPRQIILFMAQAAPLSPAEKQALLETHGLQELIDTLALLLSLNYLTTTPDTSPPSVVN